MRRFTASRLSDRALGGLYAFFLVGVFALNYHSTAMQGIVPYYADFRRIIAAGFDPAAGVLDAPTFPMWGYGWMLFLLRSRDAVFAVQLILAWVTMIAVVRVVRRSSSLPTSTHAIFAALLLVCLPWFSLHGVFWPYSPAASLLAISLFLLPEALGSGSPNRESRRKGHMLLGISALCFGIALNFRSDFVLFPVVCVILVALTQSRQRNVLKSFAWLAGVLVLLLPWGLYAKKATGTFVLTSSNSGQVLFAGLGQRPGNLWGVTADDGDPQVRAIVDSVVGENAATVSAPANRALRSAALQRIRANPVEYARKVMYGARLTLTQGFYPGSFYETPECGSDCYSLYKTRISELSSFSLAASDPRTSTFRVILQGAAVVFSRALLFLCFLALPVALGIAWKQRSLLLALSIAAVLYQAAITSFLLHLPGYTSGVIPFHLLNLSSVVALTYCRYRRPSSSLGIGPTK